MFMIYNFSAQSESPAGKNGKPSKKSKNLTPEKNNLLMQLRKLQIKNDDSVNTDIVLNTYNESSSKRGVTVGNNMKKAPIVTPVKSSPKINVTKPISANRPTSESKKKDSRAFKQPFSERFKENPISVHKINPETPKSSHSPRTKITPTSEFKSNLIGTPKSTHSPRTKITPTSVNKRNLKGTTKSTHSPRTKITPLSEFKSNLTGTPNSSHSPRTTTAPKAKVVPIVQTKQKSLKAAFESLNNSNFNNVKTQIIQSKICFDTQLPKCVNAIFLKSMENPKQIPLYVRMCREISKSSQKKDQFQLHMTNKCKSEVAQFREQARPNEIQNRKKLTHRALPLGTIIGELYKAELVTWPTIMSCMQSLVNSNYISEGSVGLTCNLINSLGKSYKRDCGNNFILSGIDILGEKCIAKSFSKSTCAKVQKLKQMHQSNQNNNIENTHLNPSTFSSNIIVSCFDIHPILPTETNENFDETLTQLKEFREISEEQVKTNVKKIFVEGIAELSAGLVCAKLLKRCYPEKSYFVKKEIQYLINEELKDVRKDLLALQDSKHGENSAMEVRVWNLSMFIAELYKVDLVAHGVVFNHLQRLNDAHFRNEMSIKLSCVLLGYIGAKLEKDESKKVITAYIKRLGENIKQFDSDVGSSIREVKELQLSNWQNNNPIVNKMKCSKEDSEISSVTKEHETPTAVTNEIETSDENVTNVIRDFLQNARSSRELTSNIKALISSENINEVTIECFCELIIIAASENVEHLNVEHLNEDLYECFEKLQSILHLSKCNVISLCPRISTLIQDVLNMRDNF